MKIQSRGAILLLFLAFLSASVFPAFAKEKASYYYSVSMEGFSSPLFSASEYADFSASIEVSPRDAINPAFSMHYLLPANPLAIGDSLAGISIDLTLFYLEDHPLAWMSPRKTSLAPQLSAAAYVPIADLGNLRYTVSLSPFRLFAGYGYFSIGAFSLVLDPSFTVSGWGLRLFDFSYLKF
ncbi:MAG: hypothetical protein WC820_08330 [Spirochaetales bacterium]|jgi:hypothetical protein